MRKPAATILYGLLIGLPACRQAQRPIFDEADRNVVWPKPPDRPRIRYLGQLTGEASLGAAKSGWTVFSEIVTGPKPTLAFSTPLSVAARDELVFVADGQNGCVFRLDLSSRRILVIDRAAGERLQWPIDVCASRDRLAVVDSRRAAVFLFDLDGGYIGKLTDVPLQRPTAIAWDSDRKRWWLLDTAAHACLVFDKDGNEVRTIGGRGPGLGEFNFPAGLAHGVSGGAVVADCMNARIQVLDKEGDAIAVFGRKGDAAGDFSLPRDVAVSSEGRIFVLDNQFENVQIFDADGQLLMAFGEEGHGPGQFYLPSGISIDERDRIWIADTYNRRIQVFQYLTESAQ